MNTEFGVPTEKLWKIAEFIYRDKKDGFTGLISRTYHKNRCEEMFLTRTNGVFYRHTISYDRNEQQPNYFECDVRNEIRLAVVNEIDFLKYKNHAVELVQYTLNLLEK